MILSLIAAASWWNQLNWPQAILGSVIATVVGAIIWKVLD